MSESSGVVHEHASSEPPLADFRCGTTLPTSPELARSKTFGYATFGAKSVLVIRVDFTNAPGAVSVEHVTNVLASVDEFYRATSFRQLSLSTVAVTPVLRLTGDAREYGGRPLQISAAARAAADAAGFNFNDQRTEHVDAEALT